LDFCLRFLRKNPGNRQVKKVGTFCVPVVDVFCFWGPPSSVRPDFLFQGPGDRRCEKWGGVAGFSFCWLISASPIGKFGFGGREIPVKRVIERGARGAPNFTRGPR